VRQDGVAKLRQRHRRSGTVNQFAAKHRFDLPQRAAERRLADSQLAGGISETTQLRQSDKIL
jgi:hypothetical protein